MVMFVSINALKIYSLQPLKARAQHRKQPSVRSNKYCNHSILRQRNYLQQNETCTFIFIDVTRNSERRAVYLEQITSNFNNVANITINSDIITLQKK